MYKKIVLVCALISPAAIVNCSEHAFEITHTGTVTYSINGRDASSIASATPEGQFIYCMTMKKPFKTESEMSSDATTFLAFKGLYEKWAAEEIAYREKRKEDTTKLASQLARSKALQVQVKTSSESKEAKAESKSDKA